MLIIVVLSVCLGDAPFFRNQGQKIQIFQNLPFFGTFTENDVAPANLYRFWWNFVCSFGYGWVYPPANFIKKSWSILEIQLHMWTSWVFDAVTFFTYTALSPAKVERSKRFFMWNCVYIYPTYVPSFSKKKYPKGSVLGINTKHQAQIMTSIGWGILRISQQPARVQNIYLMTILFSFERGIERAHPEVSSLTRSWDSQENCAFPFLLEQEQFRKRPLDSFRPKWTD